MELEKKRVELDASEREEAGLLVEGLLKGKDSSLSLSSMLHAEEIEGQVARLEKRHLLLR